MSSDTNGLRSVVRRFVGCATPVSTDIDPRGHRWSEAYLDELLPDAIAATEARADSAVPSSHVSGTDGPSVPSDRAGGEGVRAPDGSTERDAARWRWMRDHAADSDHIVFSFNNGHESFGLAGLVAEAFIDAAISEAVRAEPAATTASAPEQQRKIARNIE